MKTQYFHTRRKKQRQKTKVTKIQKLLNVLEDGDWHTTKELSRRVGHTFAVSKFHLTRYGYLIERRRHPSYRYQHQYRLIEYPKE